MKAPFPGKWSFRHHPWLREMHDSEAEENVGQKSAQMGFTENVLNIAFFHIDVKGVDVLYVLPAKVPDATDFSAARFDPALELSPHLERLFSDVKNVGHKRAGSVNLYLRGSRSRAGLKSVPVGLVILDELDEMNQENVPLAWERMSGQPEKQIWKISTATVENFGINKAYKETSQNHFCFKCPSCDRFTELSFPDSLVITAEDVRETAQIAKSHLICKECKNLLPHESKRDWLAAGRWIENKSGRDKKGWYINQLYSMMVTPTEIATSFLKAQIDRSEEQEFYNSKLGVPHVVKGGQITDEELEAAQGEYANGTLPPHGIITMGVDVGTWLHYEIDQWTTASNGARGADINMLSDARVLEFGKLRNFEDLDALMYRWQVAFCVIDAQPERRKAIEFANRFHGHVRTCFYPNGVTGKEIHLNTTEPSVNVDRTSWLDLALGRFHSRRIKIPKDYSLEYGQHLKSLVRRYDKDQWGNPVGVYVQAGEEDHYAHARNYAEIALPMAMTLNVARNMRSPI